MLTNSLLDTLVGILERRYDPEVTDEEYEDMLRMAKAEQNVRQTRKDRLAKARQASVASPIVPDPFNDPTNW
tara:strand:+ start:1493 stop:1708 length:216 start_codon:yes stop_codon:yes gene_type:complete